MVEEETALGGRVADEERGGDRDRQPRGHAGEARRPRRPARGRGGRRRGEVRRPPPRPRQADGARADRAARRPRVGLPRAVAAGGLGLGLHRRRVGRDRHRRGRGRGVHDQRQRPDREGRRVEPLDGEEDLPRLADRRGEQPPDDLARRVRRCRPADAEGDLHPRRPALPRPHAVVGAQAADDRARLRQLDRGWGVRPRHERLHRLRPRRRQGVPRRPAAGEDGDRRGVRRRVARRRRDARPGLRPRRLPRRGRARRDPDRAADRGPAQPASLVAIPGYPGNLEPHPRNFGGDLKFPRVPGERHTAGPPPSPSPTPTPRASSTSSRPTSRSRSTRAR